MTRITVTKDGVDKIVTDIAPYRAEREVVFARLTAFYAGVEQDSIDALAAREPEIVDLVNRYNALTHLIERFDAAAIRRANLLAGWEIVKQHRTDGA